MGRLQTFAPIRVENSSECMTTSMFCYVYLACGIQLVFISYFREQVSPSMTCISTKWPTETVGAKERQTEKEATLTCKQLQLQIIPRLQRALALTFSHERLTVEVTIASYFSFLEKVFLESDAKE